MKGMKKLILSIAAAVLSAPVFAQFASGGFSLDEENVYYGVRIGLNVAGMSGDAKNYQPDGTRTGLTIGGVVGLRLSDDAPVFLESGLYYTEKGSKGVDNPGNIDEAKPGVKSSLNNLEIPILVKYGIQAGDKVALLPFLGPYFSTAIGGKTNKHSSFNKGYYKHFDAGMKIGCGAEYNMLYLEAGYAFGFSNMSNDDDFTSKSQAFFLNFGVNF